MKAIHGGKAKNDKIDSEKLVRMIRGGMFPVAYVYSRKMRAARDILRRRNYLARRRAELLAHIQNTNSQYNLPPIGRRTVKIHDAHSYYLLRSVDGIGKILSMVILYEIEDIRRFPRVQNFSSYSRLVKCSKSSAGKKHGKGKALSIIAARLGRAVYFMLIRGEPFDREKFYAS